MNLHVEIPAIARHDEGILMYHDVVPANDLERSGFSGAGSNIYKTPRAAFEMHLDALARAFPRGPRLLTGAEPLLTRVPLMLTFDDGGVSAIEEIAPRLEARGWRGHFFITTGRIGTPGFLSAAQIRELHARGHAIGSHSHTHPVIMTALPAAEIRREWRTSIARLGDILGKPPRIAAVPGGYTNQLVASLAAEEGIRFLFTSEPRVRLVRVHDAQILGRFTVKASTSARAAVALAGHSKWSQLLQWLRWNGLKVAKKGLGPVYPALRSVLLQGRP